MAGGNISPRQKMINMMYLVLTALLALNISKEVLNAFVLINDSMIKTSGNFANKTNLLYGEFARANDENAAKAGKWHGLAMGVKSETDKLNTYVEDLKKELIFKVEKEDKELGDVGKKDANNEPTEVMIEVGKKAYKLKEKLIDYKKFLVSNINENMPKQERDQFIAAIEKILATEDGKNNEGKKLEWERKHFGEMPLAAAVTLLSKIQSDIRNAESDIVTHLYQNIDAASFKFNKLIPVVVAPSNYVFLNDSFTAEVFLAAFDTTSLPNVYVGDFDSTSTFNPDESLPIRRNKGQYGVKASSIGEKKWGGIIRIKDPVLENVYKTFSFKHEYRVAKANLVVSPTKMNVFYIGVENPVSISAPGVPSEDVRASISQGSIRPAQAKGDFTVKVVDRNRTANITVFAESDGEKKRMGVVEFRVKRVPDPAGFFAGKKGGPIPKAEVRAQERVFAKVENFDFDLRFEVKSFSLVCLVGQDLVTERSNSNQFTGRMKSILGNLSKGSKFFIEEIKVKGGDGTNRQIPTMSFVLR